MKKLFLSFSIFYLLTSIFLISGCMTTEYNLGTHTQDIYFFSTEKEVAMGKNVARQVAKEFQVSSNPYDIKRIEKIAKKITEVSDRGELNYYFYVIDKEDKKEEMINAFSLPGGYIYIFKDLLDILDEDQLAFVLAHEMAHIVSRHHIKRLQAAMGYNFILIASTAAPSDDNFSGGLSFALAQIISAHSREDEFNADSLAVKYTKLSGYDPKAGLELLEKLYQKSKEQIRPLSYFRTHPYPAQRIANIKRQLHISLDAEDYINF
ncbi:MAG: M48 family metalloprotease [Candidatus Omnitrophica bacterium]|nr:M48 family metalloprotease [Candidatus Omnitrophota bacterium]